jgi:hypothetical protein
MKLQISLPPLEISSDFALSSALFYLVTVQFCRFHRQKFIHRKIDHAKSLNNGELDVESSRQTLQEIVNYEFPFACRKSLEFALFRTIGIPSISKLLLKTQEMINCARRYDDTDLLISEFCQNPIDSERHNQALQRLNFIHGLYRGKISKEDMLYTLSVFTLEPIRWINKFEWRTLSSEEENCFFVFWMEIGKRMGIPNLPPTLEELDILNRKYEENHMIYDESNSIVAASTVDLLLSFVPEFLKNFGRKAIYSVCDQRLRKAMGFSDPSHWMEVLVNSFFTMRKFFLRHFNLPRIFEENRIASSGCPFQKESNTARYIPNFHVYEPTYADGYTIPTLGPVYVKEQLGELYITEGVTPKLQ